MVTLAASKDMQCWVDIQDNDTLQKDFIYITQNWLFPLRGKNDSQGLGPDLRSHRQISKLGPFLQYLPPLSHTVYLNNKN